ncbi:MAG: tape measure protein [Clostridia bacterium]|nr:tape measure protein [Clostridia bacterium]
MADGVKIKIEGEDSHYEKTIKSLEKRAEEAAEKAKAAIEKANDAAQKAVDETDEKAKKAAQKVAKEMRKAADAAEAEAKKAADEVTKHTQKVMDDQADLVGGVNKAAKGLAVGMAGAAAAVIGTGIAYNSEIEGYKAGFETMLGSAEKADEMLQNLKSFAETTPFEMSDLAGASTTLLAFGEDVENLMPDLKMLGDISLGNKEKFNGLALVFGQVRSQGKLMGQDLLQMINQGFNPLQVISEKTGESMSSLKDKMSKGEISFEMVADAMRTATSEGGQFYNAMQKQSETFAGQTSTLKDNISSLFGEMSEGVSEKLTNDILPEAIEKVEELKQAWEDGTLQQSIKTTAILLTGFGGVVGALNIGVMAEEIKKVVAGGKEYNAVTKAGTVLQKLLNKEIMMNPYASAAAALVALTAGVIAYANSLKDIEAERLIDETKEQTKAWKELKTSVENSTKAAVGEIDRTKELADELKMLADESGKVKEKDKDRASFIITELNKALGTEYELTGDIIKNYGDLCSNIEAVISKKRAEIILSSQEETYKEALNKKNEALQRQAELMQKITELQNDGNLVNNMQISGLQKQLEENQAMLDGYYSAIEQYENDYAALLSGNADKIAEINNRVTNNNKTAYEASTDILAKQVVTTKNLYENYLVEVKNGTRNIDDQIVKDAQMAYNNALNEYQKAGGGVPQGFINGIKENGGSITVEVTNILDNVITEGIQFAAVQSPYLGEALANGVASGITFTPALQERTAWLMNRINIAMQNAGKIESPSKMTRDDVGKFLSLGVAEGIEENAAFAEDAARNLMTGIVLAAQETAGIHSPADSTREGVGKWLSLGVAKGIKENSDKAVNAFNAMLEKLEYQREFDIINDEEYYTELEKLRDKYFAKGSTEWLEYTAKIYDYQKQVLEKEKKDIKSIYDEISDYAAGKIDEVIAKQENYANKLKSYTTLFNTNTIDMNGKSLTYYSMHDFSKDTQAILEYEQHLEELWARFEGVGVDSSVIKSYMSEVDELGLDEAMMAVKSLLSQSDADLSKYINGYAKYNAAVDSLSNRHYVDDMGEAVEDSIDNMRDKLQEAGFTDIPEDFVVSGKLSAEKFGEAFVAEIEKQMEIIQSKIAEFNAGLNLNVQGMTIMQTAAAGGGTTNNYSAVYNVQTSGESETATLTALRNQQLLNEMRGGW